MTSAVVMYSSDFCPFCHAAKRLLEARGVAFEGDRRGFPSRAPGGNARARGGRHTVPQIFVGEHHVGGCDELYALERAGELAPLLEGAAS